MKYQFRFTKKVRTAWVKALCSGKYDQTSGELRDDNGYCCLGVLAQINGADWADGRPFEECLDTHLSDGEDKSIVVGLSYKKQDALAKLNDDGVSFNQIAEVIAKLPFVKARP